MPVHKHVMAIKCSFVQISVFGRIVTLQQTGGFIYIV